jgi:hypothetical protein
MPVDEPRVAELRIECQAKADAAAATLVAAGQQMTDFYNGETLKAILALEGEKIREVGVKGKNFSRKTELAKLKLSMRPKKNAKGIVKDPLVFDPASNVQRARLLYEWYELPPIKNKGAKGPTTDETAVEDLLSRLERETIKPKRATKDEALLALRAMVDVNKWSVLISTFLNPELR